jgi:16S rRNA C967 or C1407 C5-methylase (RsmB/RsmF family)
MIPPLVLDAKPGHYVLDMCAAPGSKTAQLLESMMESDSFPDGLVIANDSDQKRAYMLVHQGKRLQTPCLMVTNHPAQEFPKIWMDQDPENPHYLQFDRVLADVPCSGDGTLRKNKTIFATWNANVANSLHSVQLSILNRGCELLKIGGRLVYSTCSFNPIENEAVVAAMLNKAEGSFRLVDVSTKLPELKRKPGLTNWIVRKNGQFYEEFKEGQELNETMFPPNNVEALGLERCIRVYPHLQNYGGFFVAVFEKTGAYGPLDRGKPPKCKKRYFLLYFRVLQTESDEIKSVKVILSDEEKTPKSSGWFGGKELPFLFLDKDDPLVSSMCKSYGLAQLFPRDLFLVRSEDRDFRNVYLASEKTKAVLTASNSNVLKVVNTGVKLFTKANIGEFRISAEAIQTITPYLTGQREINISYQDLAVLIRTQYPKFHEFSKQGQKTFENLGKLFH